CVLWAIPSGFLLYSCEISHLVASRRKELARHSRTNSSADNREALRNSRSGDFPSDVEIVESHARNLGRSAIVKEAGQGEPVANGLPVQFEDLFLT
ncbi:hypothetical protein MKW92_039307, partial [Papaver armeniacum]